MLHRSMPYMTLFRLGGFIIIAMALFQAFNVANRPFIAAGAAQAHPLIMVNVVEAVIEMIYAGVFLMLAAAIFFLGVGSRRVNLAYWCLQLAVWLGGISIWYQQSTDLRASPLADISRPATPWPWLVLTVVCSLALLGGYKLIKRALLSLINGACDGQEKAGE